MPFFSVNDVKFTIFCTLINDWSVSESQNDKPKDLGTEIKQLWSLDDQESNSHPTYDRDGRIFVAHQDMYNI